MNEVIYCLYITLLFLTRFLPEEKKSFKEKEKGKAWQKGVLYSDGKYSPVYLCY